MAQQEKKEEIIAMSRSGMAIEEIAEELGLDDEFKL